MLELRRSLLDPALVTETAVRAHALAAELGITRYHLTPTSIVFQLVEDEAEFMAAWEPLRQAMEE